MLYLRTGMEVSSVPESAEDVRRGSHGPPRTRDWELLSCPGGFTRLDAISYQWQPGVGMSADAARTSRVRAPHRWWNCWEL